MRVFDAQATRYCEEVKGSRDGWRLALEVFRSTSRQEARFFCLGCLQDALGARAGAPVRVESHQDRYLIREAVMGWLKGGGGGAELKSQEAFVRTKVGGSLYFGLKCVCLDMRSRLLYTGGCTSYPPDVSFEGLASKALCCSFDESVQRRTFSVTHGVLVRYTKDASSVAYRSTDGVPAQCKS